MPCTRRNHIDCLHIDDHVAPSTRNLLSYLDGWSTVSAIIATAEDRLDGTYLSDTIEQLEEHGMRDEFDEGVRDAIYAAFGIVPAVVAHSPSAS